ncbi:unnamed protein product [Cuscuta epithymum]|uniref:Uncharacterized protein n=1 Tax=Cuscuta epithymum TaxID=186058 RepID=A0AAV0CJE8_9ASTE|nr:unnamed protein product [Cuscuta epithymum]
MSEKALETQWHGGRKPQSKHKEDLVSLIQKTLYHYNPSFLHLFMDLKPFFRTM